MRAELPTARVRDRSSDPVVAPCAPELDVPAGFTGRMLVDGDEVWCRDGDPVWVGSSAALAQALVAAGFVTGLEVAAAIRAGGAGPLDRIPELSPRLAVGHVARAVRSWTLEALRGLQVEPGPVVFDGEAVPPARWLEPVHDPDGSTVVEPVPAGVVVLLDPDEWEVVAACHGPTSVATRRLRTGRSWDHLLEVVLDLAERGLVTVGDEPPLVALVAHPAPRRIPSPDRPRAGARSWFSADPPVTTDADVDDVSVEPVPATEAPVVGLHLAPGPLVFAPPVDEPPAAATGWGAPAGGHAAAPSVGAEPVLLRPSRDQRSALDRRLDSLGQVTPNPLDGLGAARSQALLRLVRVLKGQADGS